MRQLLTATLLAILCAGAAGAQEFSTAAMRPIDMDETFRLALAKSETLAQQAEGINALNAAEQLIKANFRPTAGFNAAQAWQDTPNASAASSSNQTSKTNASVNAHYNAFSGMRDYLAAKAAGMQTEAARLNLLRAKQNFYQSSVEAYLVLLSAQEQIAVRLSQLAITRERIKDLQSRERIGRSRKSEVLAAQSQLAQDQAQLQTALGWERVYQRQFQFLTGLESDFAPKPVSAPEIPALEKYMEKLPLRYDIAALSKTLDAAKTQTEVQQRLRWPVLDMDGNYYLKRPDSYSGIKWDFSLSLQLPLYTGGQVDARIRQSASAVRTAELAQELAMRQARTEVRQTYDDLIYAVSTVKALENALTLAEQNAKAQADDYKNGLVTNLDVLNAIDTMQQTRLQLEQAAIEACRAATALEVASGGPAALR